MNYFLLLAIFFVLIFSTANVFADTEFRGKNHLDIDHGDGTHTWSGGLPTFIDDGNGNFVPSIITENSTHISLDSGTPMIISKVKCDVSVYEPESNFSKLQTVLDYQIHESDLLSASFKKIPKAGFTKGCIASHLTNSTGAFITHTKTWTSLTNVFTLENVIAKYVDSELPESFHWISYSGVDTRKQYSFFIESRTMNTEGINFDFNKYQLLGNQIRETDVIGDIKLSDDVVVIELSKINTSVFQLLNPNLDSDMVFDLRKAKDQLKNVEIKADAGELTIETRFYTVLGSELRSGEKLFLDPTFGFANDITIRRVAGDIAAYTDCTGRTASASTSALETNIWDADNASGNCTLSGSSFDINTITDGSTVDSATYRIDVDAAGGTNCKLVGIDEDIDTSSAQEFYDALDGDTIILTANGFCQSTGNDKDLTINSAGLTWLEGRLSSDEATIGIHIHHGNRVAGGNNFYSLSDARLQVVYTEPVVEVIIEPRFLENDGTVVTAGEILQQNSTTHRTITVNSTGYATFTGLTGNQNFTFIETTDNYHVNKTINYDASVAGTFSSNTNIFDIDCSDTGTGDDLELLINDTGGHHITAFSTPSCSASNVITTTLTYTANGTDSSSYVTI